MSEDLQTIEPEVLPTGSYFEIEQAQVDISVATAHKYPRVISKVIEEIKSLACADQETATACHYTLEYGRKKIIGESVRLAEIVAHCYGNLRISSMITKENQRSIEAVGVCWDLEKNVISQKSVTKSIMTKHGVRYADRVIETNKMALASVAYRNALFACVPKVIIKAVVSQIKQVALGMGKTVDQQRADCVKAFEEFKISSDDVCKIMDVRKVDDLTVDDLLTLRGTYTSLKDGLITKSELLNEKKMSKFSEPEKEPVGAAPKAESKTEEKSEMPNFKDFTK